MERMTKAEMIDFLKNMNRKERILADEKKRLRGSVETLEEAIERNNFSRSTDESGIVAQGFSPDKVFRVLLNSQRDIEEETRSMVLHLRNIYEKEDQISFVRRCLLEIDTTEQLLIREDIYICNSDNSQIRHGRFQKALITTEKKISMSFKSCPVLFALQI